MNTIDTLDLVELAKQILIGENYIAEFESLDSEGINFTVKINDPAWNDSEFLDYRAAETILAIQKDFLKLANKAAHPIHYTQEDLKKVNKLVTKIKITSGCILFQTNIKPLCSFLIEQVADKEKPQSKINVAGAFTALSAMQAGCSAWLTTSHVEKLNEALPSDHQDRGNEAINVARKILLTSRKTLQQVAKRLSPEGKVSVNKDAKKFKASEIVHLDKVSLEQTELPVVIDGKYPLLGNKLDNKSVHILIDQHTRLVSTEDILPKQRKILSDAVAKAFTTEQKETPPFDLQLTAIFKCGKLSKVKLNGLGKPRPGAKPVTKNDTKQAQKQSLDQLKEQQHRLPSL